MHKNYKRSCTIMIYIIVIKFVADKNLDTRGDLP